MNDLVHFIFGLEKREVNCEKTVYFLYPVVSKGNFSVSAAMLPLSADVFGVCGGGN
jgi:hypothetical protein